MGSNDPSAVPHGGGGLILSDKMEAGHWIPLFFRPFCTCMISSWRTSSLHSVILWTNQTLSKAMPPFFLHFQGPDFLFLFSNTLSMTNTPKSEWCWIFVNRWMRFLPLESGHSMPPPHPHELPGYPGSLPRKPAGRMFMETSAHSKLSRSHTPG